MSWCAILSQLFSLQVFQVSQVLHWNSSTSFISPRAFYCWRRNVVISSSLIYQMFIIVTLSLLLRSVLLLMCVPTGKLSVLFMSMVSTDMLPSCYHALFLYSCMIPFVATVFF
jgi:hypothetical protein